MTQELNETWEKGKSPSEKNKIYGSCEHFCQDDILYRLLNIVTTQPDGSTTLTPKPIISPNFEAVRSTFNTHNSRSHLTQPFCVKQ
jgi:hypothetical protein